MLNGSWADLDGTLKWSRGRTVVVQGEWHQRSLAIGIEKSCEGSQKTLDMWVNCVLKHCLPLNSFIPNFVAFFVFFVLFCIRKMSSVTSAKGSLCRPLFHYSPPGRWTLSISQRKRTNQIVWNTNVTEFIYANKKCLEKCKFLSNLSNNLNTNKNYPRWFFSGINYGKQLDKPLSHYKAIPTSHKLLKNVSTQIYPPKKHFAECCPCVYSQRNVCLHASQKHSISRQILNKDIV